MKHIDRIFFWSALAFSYLLFGSMAILLRYYASLPEENAAFAFNPQFVGWNIIAIAILYLTAYLLKRFGPQISKPFTPVFLQHWFAYTLMMLVLWAIFASFDIGFVPFPLKPNWAKVLYFLPFSFFINKLFRRPS